MKDRSAGLVVRYNWIEGGNRNIDMVDGEDSIQIRSAPEYRKTFVYGNVLIKQDGGNNQSVHYGGDSGTTANYRKGKLYFFNNTLYSTRAGTTVVMRLSTNDEQADVRNNIFFNTAAGTNLAMLAEAGTLTLANNWAKTGWRNSHEGGGFTGSVTGGGTTIAGASPGFADPAAQDFSLTAASPAVNAGAALHADALPHHLLIRQYFKHQGGRPRPADAAFDLGAFELPSSSAPMQIISEGFPNAIRFRPYAQTLQAAGGSGSYLWSVTAGTLPAGLVIDPQTGVISGRPRIGGTATFTVTVADPQNSGLSVSKQMSLITRPHF